MGAWLQFGTCDPANARTKAGPMAYQELSRSIGTWLSECRRRPSWPAIMPAAMSIGTNTIWLGAANVFRTSNMTPDATAYASTVQTAVSGEKLRRGGRKIAAGMATARNDAAIATATFSSVPPRRCFARVRARSTSSVASRSWVRSPAAAASTVRLSMLDGLGMYLGRGTLHKIPTKGDRTTRCSRRRCGLSKSCGIREVVVKTIKRLTFVLVLATAAVVVAAPAGNAARSGLLSCPASAQPFAQFGDHSTY